jgi:hypothetical protein
VTKIARSALACLLLGYGASGHFGDISSCTEIEAFHFVDYVLSLIYRLVL